jgi:gag-polyprotein putative aspartyl protease
LKIPWTPLQTEIILFFRPAAAALFIALPTWFCTFTAPSDIIPCAAAATSQVHDAPLDEALDFYQYTDDDGVIHFVDNPAKIPAHYRSRTIVRKDTPSARQTTKVVIVDQRIHVPVLFKNGNKTELATLILDTGATTTSISEEFAARLGIDLTTARKTTTWLADGSIINTHVSKVDAVSIGFRMKSPLEVSILHHIGNKDVHDGLLGLDFLGDFQYQLDLPNELIRWQ